MPPKAADKNKGTALQLSPLIGTLVTVEPFTGLAFTCRVTNAKIAYGHRRLEVEPVEGTGRAWVSFENTRPCQALHAQGGR
jgi:hypothetical protein